MAFQTIWSVDVGKAALKAVKLRRERNHVEILAIDKVDYPLSDNGVDSAQQAKDAINVFRTRNQVKEPVVVSHPGQGTFSRFIKIPAFDAKKVKDMVRYEASQQIPFPLDEVIWDYHLVDKEYLAGEEREVGLFAVRKETIDDYLLEFTQEGLAVEMLTIGYLGLLNFIRYDINPPEPSIVVDIGAAHTDLVLVDGARFWIRPLPHSGNDVTKSIMQRFRLSFPEAERLKLETSKSPQHAEKIFKGVIQPKLQELVQEIQRSVGYFRSQSGDDVKFSRVYLLGNGSRIVGIKKYLEDALGMPVERIQSIGRLRVNREVDVKLLQNELPAFGTALGLGIQAVGAGTCQVDLVPREEKIKKEIQRKRKHVFIAAGVLLLFIVAAWLILQGKVSRLNDELNRAEEAYKALRIDSKVPAIEKATQQKLLPRLVALQQLGEYRQGSLDALRALDRVLADVSHTAPPGVARVEGGNAAALEGEVKAYLEKLKGQLWMPYLRIQRIEYPEDPAAVKAGKASGSRGNKDRPTAPAFKCSAYVMVKEAENAQAAAEVVKKVFREPLGQDLSTRSGTKLKDVTVQPGTQGLKALYHSPSGTGGGGKGEFDGQQEAGPFYGALVTWYMIPRLPPAPAEEAAEPGEKAGKTQKKTGAAGKSAKGNAEPDKGADKAAGGANAPEPPETPEG